MVKAGDPAPDLIWSDVLQPPGATWTPETLVGQVGVIFLWTNSPREGSLAALWNSAVERFAGKPVQFVWIARYADASLKQWLSENPLKGWMLLDPNWETARVYGMEMPGVVILDADHRIAGFSKSPVPTFEPVNAVLEGRVEGAGLEPAPWRLPRKPGLTPSYDVRIAPTTRKEEEGTSGRGGPDYRTWEGFRLKTVLSEVYGISESRIELPATVDADARYDFFLVLPHEESQETMQRLVQRGIEKYFHVRVSREVRRMDVYVLTAPTGIAANKESDAGGGIGCFSMEMAVPAAENGEMPALEELRKSAEDLFNASGRPRGGSFPIRRMSASGSSTMEQFCQMLEPMLDRLVVDETNLRGTYDLEVSGGEHGVEGFLRALHDQLGLVVTPDRRDVTLLVVREDNRPY